MLNKKRRKLSYELLFILIICFLVSLFLCSMLIFLTSNIVDQYLFENDIYLDDIAYYQLDSSIFIISIILSVLCFIIMFLLMFKDKISDIKIIINSIDILRTGNYDHTVNIKANNELATLAESINYLAKEEKLVKEKERKLSREKEELIRNLSHDIRTPLTSIISYTELLSNKDKLSKKEQKEYFELVLKKSKQIKDLTNILLEGNNQKRVYFEDASLLIKQLVEQFKDELENSFKLSINLSIDKFSANVDVNDLFRIFDNLITNIIKYASKNHEVTLDIFKNDTSLIIKQSNTINKNNEVIEQHNIGINSIKRIVQTYNGNVTINKNEEIFEITISLNNL